jgi:cell division transport system permease protein
LIHRLLSTVRRAGRMSCERPRAAAWALLAVTAALLAVAVAGVAARNIASWTTAWRRGAGLVVYLKDGVAEARGQALAGELGQLEGVEHAAYVDAVESGRRLERALGDDARLLDGVERGTLPGSIELTLAPGVRDVLAMSPTLRALKTSDVVDDVVVEDAGDGQLASALATIRTLAWGAAALFAGLALIIVLATVRVRLDRGRHELAVAQLLGAGPGFIVIPTALAGAVQGALAALLAAGLAAWGIHAYGADLVAGLRHAGGTVGIAPLALPELALFVGIGAALGLLGGALAGASRATR